MKKSLLLFVLLISVLGCGGGNGEKEGQITLTIMSATITENPESVMEKRFAEEYMKQNPNIKIEYIGTPMNETFKKTITLATSDSLPDMYTMTSEFIQNAYEMDIATDLNPLLGEEYVSGFFDNVIEEASVNGELLYMPWFTTPPALIYRGDWFEEEGVKPPVTWNDFLEASKKMTKDTDGDGKIDRWGFSMVGTRNQSGGARYIYILRTYGIEEARQDENGKWVSDLGTDQSKKALQYYVDLVKKYRVTPPGWVQCRSATLII